MPIKKSSLLKKLIASGLTIALLGATVGSNAQSANHSGQSIYQDGRFGQISSQLRQDLRQDGYYVMDIQADGDSQIDVYAKKDNQPYVLKYTYPELKQISSDKKEWSNVWKNKNHHQQNANGYDADIEDKIKEEARYPTVKQRAIGKMSDMGYEVKDIELEEEDNQGIFEIDAKRDSQDYEVVLGYPDLNIIKLEED